MKTITTFFTAAVLTIAGCALGQTTTSLAPSDKTPAALAEVTYDGEIDGNSELTVAVEHLPPPSELGDEYRTFVVWMTPKGAEEPRNVGQLRYDPDDREGTLDFITPYNEFALMVTAEATANPLDESDAVIVSGHVDVRQD